ERVEAQTANGATGADARKTFILHTETSPTQFSGGLVTAQIGSQELRVSTLLPAAPTYQVVNEGANGQYRVEITTTGSAQTYLLHVLGGRGTTEQAITPSVTDLGSAYQVTLAHPTLGTATIVFNK